MFSKRLCQIFNQTIINLQFLIKLIKLICCYYKFTATIYESIATVGESRVWWRADFQSGSRVLNWCSEPFLYLWHTMRFHAKKLLKTLKFWKSLNSRRSTQIFEFVWYILGATWWILMSRRFRICMAKGGRESARPSYGRPELTLISREKKSP